MWRIIKAELSLYYLYSLPFVVILTVWFAIAISIWGSDRIETDMSGVMVLALSMTAITMLFMLVDKIKTKQARFYATLPVSVRDIGVAKYIVSVVFWLITTVILTTTLVAIRPDAFQEGLFIRFLGFNGVLLYFNATYLMSRDLAYCLLGAKKRLGIRVESVPYIAFPLINFLLLLYFAILPLPYFGVNAPYRDSVVDFLFEPTGAVLLNAVGLLLTVVGILVFKRRKAYLV